MVTFYLEIRDLLYSRIIGVIFHLLYRFYTNNNYLTLAHCHFPLQVLFWHVLNNVVIHLSDKVLI